MNAVEGEIIMDPLIQELTKDQLRDDMPDFRAGDTVRVHVRVVEGTHHMENMIIDSPQNCTLTSTCRLCHVHTKTPIF